MLSAGEHGARLARWHCQVMMSYGRVRVLSGRFFNRRSRVIEHSGDVREMRPLCAK